MTTDTVLKLRIKLKTINNDFVYIKFKSVPDSTVFGFDTVKSTLPPYHLFRGYKRRMTDLSSPFPTEFYITKQMIPTFPKSITISGLFVCNGDVNNNKILKNLEDSLKIEVTYLGNCNIQIEKIYIATPNAQDLFFGVWDSTIKYKIQENLTALQNEGRGIRPIRFYMRDESNPAFFHAFRYFNRLVGNVGITEDGGEYNPQYLHHVKSPNRWINFQSPGARVSVPYMRFSSDYNPSGLYYNTLGIGPGYEGLNVNDSSNSGYESFLRSSSTFVAVRDSNDVNFYKHSLFHPYDKSSFLGYLEEKMYNYYISNDKNFAYSDKPWWCQLFIGANWISDTDITRHIACSEVRPKTGEEIRAMANQQLIMGAKGFVYDRCFSKRNYS